jgi:ribosomal-protein-alanine acetyltransferase
MPEIDIVKMSATHLAPVVVIESNIFRDPWTAESFIEILSLSPYCWVALMGQTVVGYLITQWVLDEVHILNVGVAADMQRKGIGARLMEDVLQRARTNGMRDVFLEVRVSNTAAISLYRRFGFEDVSIRKKYYGDGENALVMHCHLTDVDEGPDFSGADETETDLENSR